MLKALDDLEKAVGRMMDKARDKASAEVGSKDIQSLADEVFTHCTGGPSELTNEEAAEYIRRAIKRLKSL